MKNERIEQIKRYLQKHKSATVISLSKSLFVSTATVRRDLAQMEKQGLLERTHGGAMLKQNIDDESAFKLRTQKNIVEKRKIASLCLPLLKGESSIFLDGSSTVNCLIPLLSKLPQITVVTNGVRTALSLSKLENVTVKILGGELKTNGNSSLGASTLNQLSAMYFDYAILSCSGFTIDGVFTDTSEEQSFIKRLSAKNSKKVIVLADGSKANQSFLYKTFTASDIDYFITNESLPTPLKETLTHQNCQVITD